MKENGKKCGLYIRLTKEEEVIVKCLKKRYSINMSQFIRNQIVKLGKRLKVTVGEEL